MKYDFPRDNDGLAISVENDGFFVWIDQEDGQTIIMQTKELPAFIEFLSGFLKQ